MEKVDVTVVGAGLVGLAVTWQAARPGRSVLLLERHDKFGQETSSRNSQVIHAGIYYPGGFLKGQFCVAGNRLLYELCGKYGIPHARTGKLIVATDAGEEAQLEGLLQAGRANGAEELKIITAAEVRRLEPHVRACSAILCPTSGIVDTHRLMQFYEAEARAGGADIAYAHEVRGIEKVPAGFIVECTDPGGRPVRFQTAVLVNSAGLESGRVAAMAGIDIDAAGYRIRYLKGIYFAVGNGKNRMARMLVYPVPPRPGSVGVHTVPDLEGAMKLGPYDVWVDEIDYSVDDSLRDAFIAEVRHFLPFIAPADIRPDMAGIHPKVQRPGEPMKDYIVASEEKRGLPGLINLVGIESPGVTSSPAIGRHVAAMIDGLS